MCGIVGYLGREAEPGLTERMNSRMLHRGPDDEGYFHGDRISLGMRRLAIIDRAGGAQPIYSETADVVVVYNGEIYNHLHLRRELEARSHVFGTGADTEVLIHGYEQWGLEGLLNRLNGMFAFALFDLQKQRLFLARDRIGIKPLYYTRQNGVLYFASEVKALAEVEQISIEPNEAVLADYLVLRYVPTPYTLFKNILKLPAGHFLAAGLNGGFEVVRYWFPQVFRGQWSNGEYLERFGELFQDAVRIRLMSEVPLGAYLSEGIDSNLTVWAMTRELSRPVTTFSIGFGGKYDETPKAAESARLLGTNHHEVIFEEGDHQELPSIIWHLDEPIGDAHIIPSYILARAARRELTVILLGEGADESLYGYPFYKVAWIGRTLSKLMPSALAETVAPAIVAATPLRYLNRLFPMPTDLGLDGRQHLSSFVRSVVGENGEVVFRTLSGLFDPVALGRLLLRPPADKLEFRVSYFAPDPHERSPDGLLAQINNAQFSGWLQDNILLRHDKLAMAHSAECRVPFLDHRLVEYLAGVPRHLKVSGLKDKVLSRRFAERHLPRSIASRPKKPFFMPIEIFHAKPWFQAIIRENLSPERIRRRGYFRPEEVANLVSRVSADNFLAVKKLMSLIILELWHRVFIDREFKF
jgi:asparagine synthase (glutamine-hydrolysing)